MPLFGSFSGPGSFGKGGGAKIVTATTSGSTATPSSGLQPGNGFTYHTFTGPGSLNVTSPGYVELMVIGAGGGACGHAASGGGGAGGMAINRNLLLPTGSYSVTVPTSGAGGTPSHSSPGSPGSPSSFSGQGITITGLGGGASGGYSQGYPGGCGGGSSGFPGYTPSGQANQSYISSSGNPSTTLGFGAHGGYRWYGPWHAGNGGGGTRRPGGNAPSSTYPGQGGAGMTWPQFNGPLIGLPALAPLSGTFGGGGAGAVWSENSGWYPGGAGGGGWGNAGPGSGYSSPGGTYSVNAANHTGSGGGGTNGYYYGGSGGSGGSGLVVLRYSTTKQSVVNLVGGDGLTSANPGTSAYQIKSQYPSSATGYYYIQTASGVVPVFCDMDYDGGGWMLLHRTAGGGVSTTPNAVGSISVSTAGSTSGSVSNPFKYSNDDINYWMQWCVVGIDRPNGHTLPCFRVHCGNGDLTGTSGDIDYYTVYPNPVYGCDSGMSNAGLDFYGGPYTYSSTIGSFSMSGWDTYAQFTNSPNAPSYTGGYGSGAYTGWGTTLFYNHNSWGQQTIYNSSSNGYWGTSYGWTSSGKLWYR